MRPSPYNPDELLTLEHASGLRFAGYLLAGAPPALVPILLRPGRTLRLRNLIILRLNGRQAAPPETTDA